MLLKHHTHSKAAKLLADRTRRADLDASDLSTAHKRVGNYLAYSFVENLALENYEIQHCQGIRTGERLKGENGVALVCLMRSGLYIADGFRDVLRSAPLFCVQNNKETGLSPKDLLDLMNHSPHTIVLIDAVINSGDTIRPILRKLKSLTKTKIFVFAGVGQEQSAHVLAHEHPEVHFEYLRLSSNSYIGHGPTDTGNRLFGR